MGEGKILVEIFKGNRVLTKKRFPVEQNTVVIERGGGRNKTAYKPSFSYENSIILERVGFWPFKFLRQKLMLRYGSKKCMTFKQDEIEGLTKQDIKQLFDVSAINKAGAITQKIAVPMFLYAMLMGLFVLSMITLIIQYRLLSSFGF